MKHVTGAVNVPELKAVKQPKSKAQPADGEFKEMLSGALKTNAKPSAEAKFQKTDKASASDTKPVKGSKPAKTELSKDADETQTAGAATDTINPDMAAAAVQPPQESQQTTEESAVPEEVQVQLMAQPVMARQIQLQPTEAQQQNPAPSTAVTAAELPQTAEAVPDETQGKASETTAQAQPVQTQAQQTAAEVQPSAAQEQPDAVKQARTSEQAPEARQAQAAEANPAAQDTRNQTIPDEIAEDIVSAGTVGQTAETQAARVHTNPRQAVSPNEKPSRFDELLAKASQKLDQSKPVISEQPATTTGAPVQAAATETAANPVQTAETIENPVLPDETEAFAIPEAPSELPEENAEALPAETEVTTEVKPQTNTTVLKSETAPKYEQRPLKEIPKTDETVLGMIQPNPHEIPVPEIAKSEPPLAANPVKIPDPSEQIHTQVIKNLENQKMEFNMQLNPKELGRVDVRMILESGKLSLEIVAANQKSAELLTKQAEGLISSLKMNNLDISSVNIVHASENTSANMDSQYNLNNFQNQSAPRGHSSSNSRNHGHGGNPEGFGSQQQEESPESPQRLLNYSV